MLLNCSSATADHEERQVGRVDVPENCTIVVLSPARVVDVGSGSFLNGGLDRLSRCRKALAKKYFKTRQATQADGHTPRLVCRARIGQGWSSWPRMQGAVIIVGGEALECREIA